MPNTTVMAYAGNLYHKACLDADEIVDARAVALDEVEDDQVCDECMELLVGDETPEDVPEAP